MSPHKRFSRQAMRQPDGGQTAPKERGPLGFFSSRFRDIVRTFSPRGAAMLTSRFGADGKAPQTLEGIGREYGITRERVRQILAHLFSDLDAKRYAPAFEAAAEKISWTLKQASGIVKEEMFFELLGKGDAKEEGAIRFFLSALSDRFSVVETTSIAPSVALADFSFEEWKDVNTRAKKMFRERGTSLSEQEMLSTLSVMKWSRAFSETDLLNFLSVSRDVKKSPFGRWGLPLWPDITPRGTRERAFLVVEAEGEPLHFRDIAKRIDEYRLQPNGRTTHAQTVHNELIKDDRFVLIGRGLYALAVWGYTRGTVRDVIHDILKEKQPLSRADVITEVLKVRKVKESTIIINLNSFFRRVDRGVYGLAEKETGKRVDRRVRVSARRTRNV